MNKKIELFSYGKLYALCDILCLTLTCNKSNKISLIK